MEICQMRRCRPSVFIVHCMYLDNTTSSHCCLQSLTPLLDNYEIRHISRHIGMTMLPTCKNWLFLESTDTPTSVRMALLMSYIYIYTVCRYKRHSISWPLRNLIQWTQVITGRVSVYIMQNSELLNWLLSKWK